MEFHERLKMLRKENHMTQSKLAEILDYGSTAIANYESGRNQPSFSDLKKIAKIFKVSSDFLLGLSDVRHPPISGNVPADFEVFQTYFSPLDEKGKDEALLHMQWLKERAGKASLFAYEESDNRPATALQVAQKKDGFKK